MNLEDSIKDCISKELEKGIVEKVLTEKLEECIAAAIKDMFGYGGEVRKALEAQIKSVMVPFVESYDYSRYITKLDSVLVEVLKSSALENKKLLENFKELMIKEDRKTIKVSELFEVYKKYVADNVETDGLEVNYEDEVSYEPVEVTLEIEHEDRNFGSFQHATLTFECEHDEKMNFILNLSRWSESRNKNWDIHFDGSRDLQSLRYLRGFEVYLMKLNQACASLELDTESDFEDVTPIKKPELSYS